MKCAHLNLDEFQGALKDLNVAAKLSHKAQGVPKLPPETKVSSGPKGLRDAVRDFGSSDQTLVVHTENPQRPKSRQKYLHESL